MDGDLGGKITKMIVPGCYKKLQYGGSRSLEELILQEGVESLCHFENSTNLRSVQLPSTMKELGYDAFCGCTLLASINLPEGLETLGWNAFSETSLTSIVVPASVTNYPPYNTSAPFYNCKSLVSATVKGSVLSSAMFESCTNLKNVVLNDTILELAGKSFYNCSALSSITLPQKLKRIGSETFKGCKSLSAISIPETVTEINGDAFAQTPLQKIILPDGLKLIDRKTFSECSVLRAIYIPASVTTVEYYAFENCPLLKDVYYQAGESQWAAIEIRDFGNTMLKAATMHYNSSPSSLR